MSLIIQTEAVADAEGGVHLHLPNATVPPHARLVLKVEIDQKAGVESRFSKRFSTREEYRAALSTFVGKGSDLTFVPPQDQPIPDIQPL